MVTMRSSREPEGDIDLRLLKNGGYDALPFLDALAERISRGEPVAFPILAVI